MERTCETQLVMFDHTQVVATQDTGINAKDIGLNDLFIITHHEYSPSNSLVDRLGHDSV